MAPPDQISAQLRFQLEQLSAKNAHHEFEHLCRHLARGTICENILPATGPVSAGGDQGRDFETFRSFLDAAGEKTGGFLGHSIDGAIAFICTLEKGLPSKIKSDLKRIKQTGFQGTHVYCFSPHDLAIAKRNQLKLIARSTFGIDLEILDGQAISELLAQRKFLWIAVRYLSLPSEITPDPDPDVPDWYRALKAKYAEGQPERPSYKEFVDSKQGIRFATFNEEHRSDVLFWRTRLEHFLASDQPKDLRRRAKYEISVAAIRGLGAANDCRELIAEHISESLHGGLSDLEDAVVLLTYCSGGVLAGAIEIPEKTLDLWATQLQAEIEERLQSTKSDNDRCLLLQICGSLCLRVSPGANLKAKVTEAIRWWDRMLAHVPSASLFPLERFSDLLAGLSECVDDFESYSKLTQGIDQHLAKRSGKAVAARRCQQRAVSFAKAGKLRFALRELHRAKIDWFAAETLDASVAAMLLISRCYYELRLPVAAKYYALAAGQIAMDSKDEDVHCQLPEALSQVAQCEYAQGSWFSYSSLLRLVLAAHVRCREDPGNLQVHEDLGRCIALAGIMLAVAERIYPESKTLLLQSVTRGGLEDAIGSALQEAREVWSKRSDAELLAQIKDELYSTPFNDCGSRREIVWSALGIEWQVEFENSRLVTASAEEFVATFQVLCADFADYEMYLLPTKVSVNIEFAEIPEVRASRLGGKSPNHWRVEIPIRGSGARCALGRSQALSVTAQILGETTLLPVNDFMRLLDKAAAEGIESKVIVARPYRELYDAFVDDESFALQDRRALQGPRDAFIVSPQSARELEWRSSPIVYPDGYMPKEVVANRYARYGIALRRTLPRLRTETQFLKTVSELRTRGWLDWHILAAVFSVTNNYRLMLGKQQPPFIGFDEARRVALEIAKKPEPDDAPDPPLAMLTSVDTLEFHRRLNMGATLTGLNLRLSPGVQDLDAIERFLAERVGYWSADAPHEDLFKS